MSNGMVGVLAFWAMVIFVFCFFKIYKKHSSEDSAVETLVCAALVDLAIVITWSIYKFFNSL